MTPVDQGKEAIEPNRRPSNAPELFLAAPPAAAAAAAAATHLPCSPRPPIPPLPPYYAEANIPPRPAPRAFWRRYLVWIVAIVGVILLIVGVSVGLASRTNNGSKKSGSAEAVAAGPVPNNTLNSIAGSCMLLNEGKTPNNFVVWQNATGGLNLQVALTGTTYEPKQNITLDIPAKIGSPLSATTDVDWNTGVVTLNVFYLSGINNLTMSSITCAPWSDDCSTVASRPIPLGIPASNFTGLAAVNVNMAKDWRVYYTDRDGYLSEVRGDTAGFDSGKSLGGTVLNGSSIAALNINTTTNNINIFYVDSSTRALFKMQYVAEEGDWTKPSIVSSALIESWNPLSGLAASYTSKQDKLHVYYTGLDRGIYEFIGSKASQTGNTTWSPLPDHNPAWVEADTVGASIAAFGWNEQGRFYHVKNGNLVEAALANTTWSQVSIDTNGRTSQI
ncbi:hypothetical protein BUE80_DR011105 [Diplocarpon rosae]|nr:hypothetical protein BUE80_DR011105 [Diplocarpon rosae]